MCFRGSSRGQLWGCYSQLGSPGDNGWCWLCLRKHEPHSEILILNHAADIICLRRTDANLLAGKACAACSAT